MNSLGWISLYRKLQEHWLWEDSEKLKAWIDLLFMVNHSRKKINIDNELINIKKGTAITSILKLSLRWNWSRKRVGNFLNLLEKDEMILQKRNNRFTMITILNYNKYQKKETSNVTPNVAPDVASKEHPKNIKGSTKGNTNNNDNNINNENNENNSFSEKQKPKKQKTKRPYIHFPDDFILSDKMRQYCIDKIGSNNPESIFNHFKDHHISNNNKFADWEAAWRNWCRNVKKFNHQDKNSVQNIPSGQYLNRFDRSKIATQKFIEEMENE